MDFKIIAIRPLSKCSLNFVKVLKRNELYYLYNDYEITEKKGVESIRCLNKLPKDLYRIAGKPVINISAIVGKNGCGKSSIIELLFRAINNISCNFKYVKNNPKKTITAELMPVDKIHVEFYFHSDAYYKIIVHDQNFEVYKFDSSGTREETPITDQFSLENLFYTEAINYSHYAYNSHEFGDWLTKLFHKNDSYQTPLVLNPMRTDGNFDINTENRLVKQRVLANLLRLDDNIKIDFRKFGDNLTASSLYLTLNKPKHQVEYYSKSKRDIQNEAVKEIKHVILLKNFSTKTKNQIVINLLDKVIDFKDFDYKKIDKRIYGVVKNYLLHKLISICVKYNEYNKFFLKGKNEFKTESYEKFLNELKEDKSHITFKLKQTLNYLKFDYLNYSRGNQRFEISKLAVKINDLKEEHQSILELLPPPIFNIEVLLNTSTGLDQEIKFSSLSSGEKQLIYSVSSILYHLYNLDSVRNNKIQYKCINIILEEIELYFHPELQRKYIKYIIDSIERLNLQLIESVNICFITHSPFILSDIPHENILFLQLVDGKAKQQKRQNRKTFAANIHELLSENFFFESGIFIGDFAKAKIDETIQWITTTKDNLDNAKKNNGTENTLKVNEDDLDYYRKIILMIDEPIIKLKLSEMINEIKMDVKFHDEIIDQQVAFLLSKRKT